MVRAPGSGPLHDAREDPSGAGASSAGIWQSGSHEACRQLGRQLKTALRQLEGATRQLKTALRRLEGATRQLKTAPPTARESLPTRPPEATSDAPGHHGGRRVPAPRRVGRHQRARAGGGAQRSSGGGRLLRGVRHRSAHGARRLGHARHRLGPRMVGPGGRSRSRGPHRRGHRGGGPGLGGVRPLPALPGRTARAVRPAPARRHRRRPLGRLRPLPGHRPSQPHRRSRHGRPARGGLRRAAGGGHARRHQGLVPARRAGDGVRLRPDRSRGGGRAGCPRRGGDRGRAPGETPRTWPGGWAPRSARPTNSRPRTIPARFPPMRSAGSSRPPGPDRRPRQA